MAKGGRSWSLDSARALLPAADADDAWSETFLAALRAYPDVRPDSNLEAWLVTIARRKVIDQRRAGARRPATVPLEPELASADVSRGEVLGFACAACHRFRAEEGTLIGPSLHGVFGRPAASVEGFAYSAALRESGLVWTPRSLEAWLANPSGFVAGTTMAFTGYRSAEDRRDLIAYLLHVTQ